MRRARNRLPTGNSPITPYTPLNSNTSLSNDDLLCASGLNLKGYCVLCGRKLKSEASKKKGVGVVCERKAKNRRSLFN